MRDELEKRLRKAQSNLKWELGFLEDRKEDLVVFQSAPSELISDERRERRVKDANFAIDHYHQKIGEFNAEIAIVEQMLANLPVEEAVA